MAQQQQTYLVVGGCGFLGKWIVQEIIQDQDLAHVHVRVFDLRIPDSAVNDDRVTYVQGDLCKPESVNKACEGVHCVIHTASPTHGLGRALYYKVNVEGTRNLINACLAQGVPNLVYTSSASVVFDGSDLKGVDETTPYCKKHLDPYSETKQLAEEEVLKAASDKLKTLALRPSGIFGPGDVQAWPGFIEAAQCGKSKYQMGNGDNKMDWTYVENLAYGHVLAAKKLDDPILADTISGEAFFMTNDEPIPFWDMAKYIWKGLGYPQPTIHVPIGIVWYLSILIDWFVLLLSPIVQLHPTITFFRIANATAHRYFSIEKAKKLLGYKPRVPLDKGMEITLESFQHMKNKT